MSPPSQNAASTPPRAPAHGYFWFGGSRRDKAAWLCSGKSESRALSPPPRLEVTMTALEVTMGRPQVPEGPKPAPAASRADFSHKTRPDSCRATHLSCLLLTHNGTGYAVIKVITGADKHLGIRSSNHVQNWLLKRSNFIVKTSSLPGPPLHPYQSVQLEN